MPKKRKLPKDVIEHWPEVFEDIDVEAVPVDYLDSIRITFNDGTIWDVDVATHSENVNIEEVLEELLLEYEENIKNINFRIDTEKVKHDITKRTNYFLKKRK